MHEFNFAANIINLTVHLKDSPILCMRIKFFCVVFDICFLLSFIVVLSFILSLRVYAVINVLDIFLLQFGFKTNRKRSERKRVEEMKRFRHKKIIGPRPLGAGAQGAPPPLDPLVLYLSSKCVCLRMNKGFAIY